MSTYLERWYGNAHVCASFFLLLVVFSFFPGSLSAATSDFRVRTFVGEDTTPPTVPGSLTATPVATTQINLAWSTSTDDVLFSGYYVYRDDIQIATTTVPYYSDTGRTPSTLYSYYVTAFDFAGNVSASSSVVSTTTLSVPPPTATTTDDIGVTYGSRGGDELVRLLVIPGEYGARVKYETQTYMRGILRWGETINYELGTSREEKYEKVHDARIDGLRPDTWYYLRLEGIDSRGRTMVLHEGSFRTLSTVDTTPPGIVDPFTLTSRGDDVIFSWQNPSDIDFDHVRIVRNNDFYPRDEVDGWVMYEGSGTEKIDTGALAQDDTLYYSIFAYDREGNVSAGAVGVIRKGGEAGPFLPPLRDNPIDLHFSDVVFLQDGTQKTASDGTLLIDGARHLTILLPYERMPEHLKTILVRIVPAEDPTRELSFILRVNKERTFYTARLAPFGVTGLFHVYVSVFDYKTEQQGFAEGMLEVTFHHDPGLPSPEGAMGFLNQFELWHILALCLILILIAYLISRILGADRKERVPQSS